MENHNFNSMGCCKEDANEQCGGVCGGIGCTCDPREGVKQGPESCCDSDDSNDPEMSCCQYEEEPGYSNALDAGKLVVLSILTMAAYHVYWMYRNWKHIKEQTNKPIRPIARTVAVLFPILDIVLFCTQFKEIHALTKKEGRRSFPLVWVCVGYSVLLLLTWAGFALSILSALAGDTSLAFDMFFAQILVTLLMTLVLLPVQLALNDFWAHEQHDRTVRTSYSNGEIAWVVVGGLFLLISLASLFMPPPPFDYPEFGTDNGVSLSRPQ